MKKRISSSKVWNHLERIKNLEKTILELKEENFEQWLIKSYEEELKQLKGGKT